MARMKSKGIITKLLVICLVSSLYSGVGIGSSSAAAPTVAGGGTVSYTMGDAATSIGSGLTIANGTAYDGNYIEFAIASSATSDILSLASVSVPDTSTATASIVGSVAYWGNGTTATQIGTVDLVNNGTAGRPLRINLAESFTNSGFELNDSTNWTFMNSRIDLGVTVINGFTSNDGQNDYSTTTANPQNDNRAPTVLGTYLASTSSEEKSQGTYSLKLTSFGMTTGAACDVVHGPAAYSSTFDLTAGDQLFFDWSAVGGADAWDAYGYLLNTVSGAQIELLDQNGPRTPRTQWATQTATISTTGSYSFVFVNGTFDETCGRAAGGTLYIDNIRIIGQRVTDAMVQQIARLVQYRSSNTTTLATGTKTVTLTAVPFDSTNATPLSGSTTITLNITGVAPQAINFPPPSGANVGSVFDSNATADSGLTVSLSSSTTNVCTVSGLSITPVAAGSCTIVASQAGGTFNGVAYGPATSVTRIFTVTQSSGGSSAPLFLVSWNPNSGSGYMFPQYGYFGGSINLYLNTYKRDGYTFTGWNTKADGTGISYSDGASFKAEQRDELLYAQWKLITTKPTITWATPVAIQEGTALSATQLNALAGVAGTYTYAPALTTVLPVGKHTLKVTFVPTDPKFEIVETTVGIEVLAKARVTWANPAAIVEGTALSATQLNALASVPGSFSYAPAAGTLLAVGKQTLRVTFTPTDTRLSAVTAEVVIDVTAKPEIIPAPPVSPTYSVTGAPKTSINWGAGENASSYTVLVDGKNACVVAALTCDVALLLGPKNVVTVTSVAASGKTSAAVRATYAAPASAQVLTVVNFDSARAVIKSTEAAKLRAFAAAVRAAGYTTLTVYGHTDSVGGVDNRRLSVARANSTITFLKRALPGVKFTVSGFAASTPVADNSTAEGKAANRRAEIFIP